MQEIDDWLQSIGFDGADLLGNLILTTIALIVSRWVSRKLRSQVITALSRKAFGRNDAILVGRLVSISVYLVATVVVLIAWGVNSTGILTALGAFSVALGLSLQDVFRNFFSGVLLLMEKPFKVGDHVQVQQVEGEVLGIDIRTTLVRTANGATVMVPNSIMYSQVLTTRSGRGMRRLDLTVVAKGMDVGSLSTIIAEGIALSGVVIPPVQPATVVSTSREKTEVVVSLLVSAQPEHRQTVINAVMAAAGDHDVEITVT